MKELSDDLRAVEAALFAASEPLSPDDIAEAVWWTASLPPHVNVNLLEVMPVVQSFAGFQIAREP